MLGLSPGSNGSRSPESHPLPCDSYQRVLVVSGASPCPAQAQVFCLSQREWTNRGVLRPFCPRGSRLSLRFRKATWPCCRQSPRGRELEAGEPQEASGLATAVALAVRGDGEGTLRMLTVESW